MPTVPEAMKTDINRRQAIRLVRRATERLNKAQSEQRSAIRFASEVGASLREIALAADVSHMTVKNLLDVPVDTDDP
jgi:DNA-directed RNA polymerase specialized sigma24 family protein